MTHEHQRIIDFQLNVHQINHCITAHTAQILYIHAPAVSVLPRLE